MTVFQKLVLKSLVILLEYLVIRKDGYHDKECRNHIKKIKEVFKLLENE